MTASVALLVGRERSFPDALIGEINRRDTDVRGVYAAVEATRSHLPPAYDVIIDRISHDVVCYQPWLKLAVLGGSCVVNNPFWRIADDKFFNVALAERLGIRVPKTVLLPSKSYGADISTGSLANMRMVDWDAVAGELGWPMYMKPHWGGGWREVTRVSSPAELHAAYDRSGSLTMILQEEIRWEQYVRCLCVGKTCVLPALWDPRRTHFERYTRAAEDMPPLSDELRARVTREASALCTGLGYDMNTVEFAVRDGVPYAIDFMNSAPDLDITSLGEQHFGWAVEKMADFVVGAARTARANRLAIAAGGTANPGSWDELLRR